MNRIRDVLASITRSPSRSPVVGLTGLAAVVGGALIAGAVTGAREGGQASDASPSLSAIVAAASSTAITPSATPTPSASSLSPTPSPSQSSSPSHMPEASPVPATPVSVATPAPMPTPTTHQGFGGLPGQTVDITGRWETLAAMPGGSDFQTSDSLVLPDGRIVVFRWDWGQEDESWPEVVIYDIQADAWEPAGFLDDRPLVGTDSSFALASDGRIYSLDRVIEIDGPEWDVAPFHMARETEVWAGMILAAGSDGRIYRRADDAGSSRTELVAYDPDTDAFERTSSVAGSYGSILSGDDTLTLFGAADSGSAIISYDPATDAWSSTSDIEVRDIATNHAAMGPDGLVYVPGFYPDSPILWAISPEDGRALLVEMPAGVDEWAVDLLWAEDDRLYAFGRDQVWAFTPDN